ncbi:hypothetical protein K1T71_004995 [Dendrolimus kikuchii]|uniref:Uncharacterized protein n=1 Tax=Dendrolimus kikuchii TaxID=765133 RepID=A0ACC1D5W0_9NEOP|nr:hypothetical protein K1T71_004995 [Dendrolimus kikuchii]
MTMDPQTAKKEFLDEIINRKKMGDKKFHSESSLQHFAEDDENNISDSTQDPGVLNVSLSNIPAADEQLERKRTMSQPGPVSGNISTASATRATRRRPPRSVMYAPELQRSESTGDKTSLKLSPTSKGEESGTATPVGERHSPLPYNNINGNFRNGDIKSLSNYRLYIPSNDMRGTATPRNRSVATMDAQSIRSVETQAPPPTSPEDNKKYTREYLSLVLSCIYATLLVTFGLVACLADSFIEHSVAVIYSLILCIMGFIYLTFLIFDITRYKSIALKNSKIRGLHEERLAEYFSKQDEVFGTPSIPGDRTPDVSRPPSVPPPMLIPLKHHYCFNQGRHSGSFYLKIGAAGFAVGHLVHSILLITVQVGYLFDDDVNNSECVDFAQVVLDIMFPCYCFLQLYFIFKYSNVIILRGQVLARFAFMHMIGSSLCFWILAIVRETILALTVYAHYLYGNNNYSSNDHRNATIQAYESQNRILDISGLYNENCITHPAIMSIAENLSPYLYPFSVEFNILIVAVYYIIWSNIGGCDNEDNNISEANSIDDNHTVCRIPTANEDNDFTSNIIIHADCHASNRGFFFGLLVTIIVLGVLILGFVFSGYGDNMLELGSLLNECTKLALHCLLLIAAIFAFNQTRKLDINEHPISLLDDVLLFICLPAFFLETILSTVATINILNVVRTIDFLIMMIQVLIQTPLIMDGLRRCSNAKKLRRQKPGRELLMLLLIANVAMWLFNTFSYKASDSLDERYAYYGKVLWTILGHISLPLIMFYRFHSSVCFADIWDSAYKPGSDH